MEDLPMEDLPMEDLPVIPWTLMLSAPVRWLPALRPAGRRAPPAALLGRRPFARRFRLLLTRSPLLWADVMWGALRSRALTWSSARPQH
jgi:hypothetical protein